jgi:superfamily II DNA or RNA helicase/ribosome modulation factor
MLSRLIEGVSTWDELESRIASLPSEQERGEAFEQFCKPFLLLDPVFQFKEVYRQKEIPPSLLEKLGYPVAQDIGIDGLGVTTDGKLFAYQAKFRSDRNNTPTLRELSTFFTMSDKADWRITITNANKLPSSIDDRTRQSRVLADRLDRLDADFLKRIRIYLKEQSISPPKRKNPNRTQQEAIKEAMTYFETNKRGQLILPCGTGKTLVAMWIAEKFGSKRILVMVPSLALLSQTLREWALNTSIDPFRYLCLCSDTTVDLGNDAPVEHFYEMDVPVTTDVETVADFLTKTTNQTSILFSTYQSSKVLSEASLKARVIFDTAILDEAHRTTGTKAGVWNISIDDRKVPIKKRIFMTATPRIYAPHITKKAKEDDVLLCSMDDESIYGKPFYEMTFGEAILRGHISDYKIVVICITDSEVREIIQRGGRVVIDDEYEWEAKALAKRIALIKGINSYGLKKVFSFHSRVKGAKTFTDTTTPYNLHSVTSMLPIYSDKQIQTFHVNGTMPSGMRNGYMKEFKKAGIGIMSNARCLNEGVDVPAVDTVAFIDPKKSLIDIVQATGRAMRKAAWKERGYIFIPVVIDEDTDPEQFIESSDFKTVWQVLQAMMDQDQRLEDIVSQLRIMQGKGEIGSKEWEDAITHYNDKIDFYNIQTKIKQEQFIKALYIKTIEVIGRKWNFWFGLTLKYKEQTGDPNTPQAYKTPEGFKLGHWQGRQRSRKSNLSAERIKRLEEIGFVWDKFEEAFEKGYQETLRYKKQFGDPNAPSLYKTPEGYRLGGWQNGQRDNYKKSILPVDRIKRLEEIGFVWDTLEAAFEKGYEETLRYKKQTGDPNAPQGYKTPVGFKLGNWQSRQRDKYIKSTLPADKIKRFEEIGFVWDMLEEAFEKGYQETLRYKKQTGNPNTPNIYKTPEGFKLGSWQNRQRAFYRKNKLSPDRIRRLEEIGFVWDFREEFFEKGFRETLMHKKQTGDPNAPFSYITPEDFKLGIWQNNQKRYYKKGILPVDRIKRLEEIGFVWDSREEFFEKGFEETLRYKEQTGDPNAPVDYTTSEGFKLGRWQQNQRSRKSNLSAERIKRLEEIGFVWDILEASFEKGYEETLKYKEQTGNPNALQTYKTSEGYNLGHWQTTQRQIYKRGKLLPDRIKRLKQVGFIWDTLEAAFEKGFRETLKYKEQTGNPNTPQGYETSEGFKLGIWQNGQRQSYKKGKMPADRIKRFEEIGFVWDTLEAAFEKGYEETLRYKKQTDDPNAPVDYTTSEGFKLGMWQFNRRQRKNKLSADKIKRLEHIGFIWDPFEEAFKKGVQETLRYKEQYGDPNAPQGYKTPEGFKLGIWQCRQRMIYSKGKLSVERIKRLEEIGFKWKIKE